FSYWTVTPGLYEKEYLPKINSWFNKFCARDYYPFKIGTFIPSIITRGLTGFYETVDGYYASRLRVSKKIEGLFWKLFPARGKELDVDEESGSASRLFDKLAATFNEQTNGLLDYSAFAFSDMHSCKTYLSFMLSFDEKTVFSDLGSSQIVLRGNYDCAVFNSKGDVVVRVLDGILQFSSIRVPVGAMYVPGVTVIGLPANDDFTVVISNDSLLPTIISVAVEHYDSASYLVESFHRINMYPHRGMVYTFSAGKITLSQTEVNDKKIRSKPARRLADAGGLNPGDVFRIQPEINFNSDFNFGYGMRFGTRKLYAGFLLGHSVTDLGQSVDLSLGGGHQESLYGGIMFDMEAYSKITCALSKPEEVSRFNLVPELRLSLVYKPFHRVQFFAGGVFDFKIKDFNTGAFVSDVRSKNLGTIEINDKVSIVPSINVGLRF
ncbi:MAG: hypothetical protein J6Z17_00895, partial [Treponema sp.]|nr:hypothetical protein [Treponema sp.]